MNSGIYLLYNIFNGKKYIGSSRNLRHRKNCHFSGLRRGNHENYKIQKDYKEYGEIAFRWEVLETCDIENLVPREQWWLDSLKPEYNIALTADNHTYRETASRILGRKKHAEKMRGRIQSQEERDRRGQAMKEYWGRPENKGRKKCSDAQKQHLSKIMTGKGNPNWGKHRTTESKKKSHDSVSKVLYTFKSPTGEEITTKGLMTSAESELGIPYGAARNLYRGLTQSHNGWTFVKSEKIG